MSEPNLKFSMIADGDFILDKVKFKHVAQCVLYQKAKIYGNDKFSARIISTMTDVGDMLEMIRRIQHPVNNTKFGAGFGIQESTPNIHWDHQSERRVVYEAYLHKFAQCKQLREELMAQTDKDLLATYTQPYQTDLYRQDTVVKTPLGEILVEVRKFFASYVQA